MTAGISTLGSIHLIFINPGVKAIGVYCCDKLLRHDVLPAIREISRERDKLSASYRLQFHAAREGQHPSYWLL